MRTVTILEILTKMCTGFVLNCQWCLSQDCVVSSICLSWILEVFLHT